MNHPFKKLLAHKNFKLLWSSQLLSQLTINLVNFSILSTIFEQTSSSIAVSLLWVAYSLPALFFAPFSGSIVDAFSRRKMMIATNFLQAITVSLYLFVPDGKVFILYALVFIYSALDQLYLPSQQASLPKIVGKELLPSANGLFLMTQQASFLVGFGLGGILLSIFSRDVTTIISTVMLLLATLAVYILPKDSRKESVDEEKNLGRFWDDFKEGFAFVRGHPVVMFPLLLIVFTQVFITIIATNLPSYTKNILGMSINHASITLVVPGAAGAFLLTYYLHKILKKTRKKIVIQNSLFMGGLCLLAMAGLRYTEALRLPLSIAVAVGLGISIAGVMVPAQTLLQEHTPSWFRGRVYSSLSFLLIGATSVPLIISAAITDAIGISGLFVTLAVLLLSMCYFIYKRSDHVLVHGIRI
ncbi:MAG: MFS transporter [Patescibacteria group bacterium]